MDDRRRKLAIGTAPLGMPYGLPPPGRDRAALIPADDAADLVRAAFDAGIVAFDTAPGYGEAEARLGASLGARGEVWTKIHAGSGDAASAVGASLARLRRPRVAVVHWHNWTRGLDHDATFSAAWRDLAGDPRVAALGCSTYGSDDARAAVRSGLFRQVQVEWNLLNQGVVAAIADEARAAGVRIAVRSVLLQGVLTAGGRVLPPGLEALEQARVRALELARRHGLMLDAFALRAALDHPAIDRVIVGLDHRDQLAAVLAAAASPPLPAPLIAALAALDLGGDPVADPRAWPRPGGAGAARP